MIKGRSAYTVSITATVKFTLTDRIGSEPNLSIKWSIIIDTMLNFDGQGHGIVRIYRP